MGKKMRYFIFSGLFLFFASTGGALASVCDLPLPDWCEANLGKGGIWNFEFISGPTLTTHEKCGSIEECYEYQYLITPPDPLAPIGQAVLGVPSNCELQIEGANQVYDIGKGDPDGFGAGYWNLFVARFPPVADDYLNGYLVTVYANTGGVGFATIGIYSKNYFGSCGLTGPDPNGDNPNEVYTVAAITEMATQPDGRIFRIWENADTQCIEDVCEIEVHGGPCIRQLNSVPLDETIQYDSEVIGWEPMIVIGNRNQKCFRAHGRSEDKDHTWIWISGRRVWR